LLLVFAMAAAAAIFLYMQLPRVAFEAQRDREDLLIQRGKDYKRAIELYVRRNNKYPERLEDLERQMEVRYLRRRHKDPFTSKDDWRVIRISASGKLEGSLVQKAKEGDKDEETAQDLADDDVAENSAVARYREGDERLANAEFPGGVGGSAPAGDGEPGEREEAATNPLDEALVPIIDSSGNVVQQKMTEAQAQQRQSGDGQSGAGQPGAADGTQNSNPRGPRLGPGGIPIIENPADVVARQNPQAQPGVPGAGAQTPGGTGGLNSPGATAENMIGRLLTTPVPGGLAGIQQRRGISGPGAQNQPQSFGAGIAGVASRFEMRGIKVYDDQDSIHKWEFVFDARKQQQRQQSTTQGGGRGASTPQRPGYSGGGVGSPQPGSPRTGRR
jgi:hypothetical protein